MSQNIYRTYLFFLSQVKLVTGLYHGPDILCALAKTEETLLQGQSCTWNVNLTFDHLIKDLPEMTRVCFMLMAVSSVKKKQKVSDVRIINLLYFRFLCPKQYCNQIMN